MCPASLPRPLSGSVFYTSPGADKKRELFLTILLLRSTAVPAALFDDQREEFSRVGSGVEEQNS
ncbi:hypothetical protein CE91St58_35610 [Lachnospiraceae bacterium]|nr:hypothetical protein CE91St58_35610 [Lachnospiraceae bacterium]